MPNTNRFIFDTADPSRQRVLESYFNTATLDVSSQVRNDKTLALTVEPVVKNPDDSDYLYSPDYEATDAFEFSIGLTDQPATGGTFKLTAGSTTTDLTAIVYNVTAAALQTPLSAAFVTEGESANTVTLLATGVYQIDATTNGAIASGFLVGDGALLNPQSSAFVIEESLGSASTKYRLLLVVRQSPMCFAEPATALPATGVTASTEQAGSSTQNKIQKIAFDAADTYGGTYRISAVAGAAKAITSNTAANPTVLTLTAHGWLTGDSITIPANNGSSPTIAGTHTITRISADTFSIPINTSAGSGGLGGLAEKTQTATAGVAKPTMQPEELAAVLAQHPQIYFQEADGTADNIKVSKTGADYFVEFIGSLGLSNVPALTVTNINLIAPKGVSGTIGLNTIPLYRYSLTESGDTFSLLLSITRVRASGERRTIFGPVAVTIAKELCDPLTMVPTPLPSYYTDIESDARFAPIGGPFESDGGTAAIPGFNFGNIGDQDTGIGQNGDGVVGVDNNGTFQHNFRATGFESLQSIKSLNATGGVGYGTGAGGTVTQATSKSTGVTLDKVTGAITMNGAALAGGAIVTFLVTNSAVAATDFVDAKLASAGTPGTYSVEATGVSAGSFSITVTNKTGGSLSEAIVLRFIVLKGVSA